MHRFFIPPECIQQGKVVFPSEFSHQISSVLRLNPGQHVLVLDNLGSQYDVELILCDRHRVTGQITGQQKIFTEPKCHLHLYISLSQREKFEWILQKCTEIGASAFTPLISSRCLVQEAKNASAKMERWQRIVREAAEQSGRGFVPPIQPPLELKKWISTGSSQTYPTFILWENEQRINIKSALVNTRRVNPASLERLALLVGPEGGFSEDEIESTLQKGVIPVSLGKRILRMETAAIAATAITLYELGDMD